MWPKNKKEREKERRHRGEVDVKTESEIRVMHLQAKDIKDHQKPPDSPWEPTEGTNPANILVLDFWLPELRENEYLLF